MPTGRVPVRGGIAWGRLSNTIGLQSLEPFCGDRAAKLSLRDAQRIHEQIRDAVNLYRLAHGGSTADAGPQTATRISEAVGKVKRNAAGAIRSNYAELWLDRLDDALSVKLPLIQDLHYAMRRLNHDILALRRRLDARSLTPDDKAVIEALAVLSISTVVPKPVHPDPPLTRLVPELAPIWTQVTGTSAYPQNNPDGEKVCRFANWIETLIKAAGLRPPPYHTVARLVRRRKKQK